MKDVSDAFSAAGCRGVRTFIQSGNVIFESPEQNREAVVHKIRNKLRGLLDAEPGIVLRTVRELERLVRDAPFKKFEAEAGIKLYVAFLFEKPGSKPRFPLLSSKEALEAVGMKSLDVFILSRPKKNGFYGFPNNFIEKELGAAATTRNWSTVTKIVEFVRGAS